MRIFLVERLDHRVDVTTEHGIHHPAFKVVALNAGDRRIVFDPQQQPPALKIGQRHDLLRDLLRPQIVSLELHP